MKLAVEILSGGLFYIEVGTEASIGDLKREIGTQQKLPHERMVLFVNEREGQRLVTGGKDGDDASLGDCGIKDGFHVYLYFAPVADDDHKEFVFTRPEPATTGDPEETNKQSHHVIQPKENENEIDETKEQGNNGQDEAVEETEKEEQEDEQEIKEDPNKKMNKR